ncbi:hypothetical protein BC332_32856 [Capsicum chinense]|nr:hypothetical protein BC332_32856 [Capsicum chinense]
MASKVSIISTCTVKAGGIPIEEHHPDNCKTIELTPWDILELQIDYFQTGLLFLRPTSQQISSLHSVAEQSGTTSFFINCNNAGVQFNHGIADGVTVGDILESKYVPHVVLDFFPLNGVQNQEATSQSNRACGWHFHWVHMQSHIS